MNSQDLRLLGSKGESQTDCSRNQNLSEPQSFQLYNGQAHTSVPQRFNKMKSKEVDTTNCRLKKMYKVKCKLSFIETHVGAAAQETSSR